MTAVDLTGAVDVITGTWLRWESYQPRLERDVYENTEPSSIVAAVNAFCRAKLGSSIDHHEFYSTGIGSTHGLCLDDGRRVVVKVHRTTTDVSHLAAEALRRLDEEGAGEPAIGHNDWRIEQLRFAGGKLAAAWDWDSLGSGLEPAFAGSSAHCFTADYRADDLDVMPTLEEALAFLADFEAARGAPFSSDERRTAVAALVATMACSARCEHADVLTDWGSAPARPAPRSVPADTYRGFLALHGSDLLGVQVSGVPPVCEA